MISLPYPYPTGEAEWYILRQQAELSFWLAVESWRQGYMSEAVQAVLQYGFESLGLNRLYVYI